MAGGGSALARSAVALRPPADVLVHGLKYEGWRELAPMMAELMERRLVTVLDDLEGHVITYVPTSAAHRRRRGYDQAELLARALAGCTGAALRAPAQARQPEAHTGFAAPAAADGQRPRRLLASDPATAGRPASATCSWSTMS